jgi:hypothetical protein
MHATRTPLSLLARAAAIGLGLLLVAAASHATPRYAARYEQTCSLCHDDPSGGGKRCAYAAQYIIPAELATLRPGKDAQALIDPQLGRNLSIGLDLRTLHLYSDDDRSPQNFFEMQGDLYFAFDLAPRLSAYVQSGLSGAYEVYGLARVLPASGYVKVGRFAPPYGWRLADHTAFVREYGGFRPPAHTDVGIEAGLFPGRFTLQAAVVNGARGSTRDVDRDLAASGLVLGRFHPVGLALAAGASFAYNPREVTGERVLASGPFGSLNWKRFTWVAEVDWQQRGRASNRTTGLLLSHELSCQLARGVDLLLTHDFRDPDLDRRSGAQERFGVGCEWLATPNSQVRLALYRHRFEDGPELGGDDHLQTEAQIHFLY